MTHQDKLVPAEALAAKNTASFPNESAEYRAARNALLAQEIEVRRARRARGRAPPPAAARRRGARGLPLHRRGRPDHPLRPLRRQGHPRHLQLHVRAAAQGALPDVHLLHGLLRGQGRRHPRSAIALAFVARSPIERLVEAKRARGWTHIPVYSDLDGDFTRAYVSAEDADMPGLTVFTRRDGAIRHFWSGEIGGEMADPGQDPRGQPEMDPLWLLLDTTPGGRGSDWYPKLAY